MWWVVVGCAGYVWSWFMDVFVPTGFLLPRHRMVQWLHAKGVSLEVPDAQGRAPFHYACLRGHLELAKCGSWN